MTLHPPESNPTGNQGSFWLIDGHEDIAWNGLVYGRHPSTSAYSTREADLHSGVTSETGIRTLGLPEWLSGRVGIVFSTIFIEPGNLARPEPIPTQKRIYHNPEEANRFGLEQLQYYRALAESDPHFRLITDQAGLEAISAIWDTQANPDQIGLVILMEGADPILRPEAIHEWAAGGLRIVGLAWSATRYAGGTHMPGPLTGLGRSLLKEMAQSHLILDLSHAAEEAYLEAVDRYEGVVIASHSNPRRFLPTDRGLSDEMILKLVARDGVIGIVPFNHFLDPDWIKDDPPLRVEKVIEAIDTVAQLSGDAYHVAIGTDFDGGFGAEAIPAGMDSIADVINLSSGLAQKGYQRDEIQAILHGNWLRVLRNGLP